MSVGHVQVRRLLCTAVVVALVGSATSHTLAVEHRVYEHTVDDDATWQRLSKQVGSDRFSKFIIDLKSGAIYFIDVNLFKLHSDFVFGVLLKTKRTARANREYNLNYTRHKPRFILGYVTHHLKVDVHTFAFWEGDEIDAKSIRLVHDKLEQSYFVKDLAFRPDSPKQEAEAKRVAKLGLKTTTNDALYKAAPYQAFNKGEAVGRLRVVPVGTPYESLLFERDDIVVLQESYLDISPVAGILATVFSTPLSHVNLRARAWNIPNAGFVNARKAYESLNGEMVYLSVEDAVHELRKATPEEIAQTKARLAEMRTVRLPEADLKRTKLTMLSALKATDSLAFGTKTANLGAIASAKVPGVHVPPGFGIPFARYADHMRRHGLDTEVAAMLDDPRWSADRAWRTEAAERMRTKIRDAELDPALLDRAEKLVRTRLAGQGVFVRSSTNAEDLEGFNGAGLYDTVPNVRGRAPLADAIRRVWASLWNARAIEEREHYGIDHRGVYGAVLVQYGIDATAAGVLVTTNLFDPEEGDTYTINAKRGLGIRVVEGATIPEQVLFDTSNDGTKIISRSDDPTMLVFDAEGGIVEIPNPNRGVILNEARTRRLARAVEACVPLIPSKSPLDVEWALSGEKIWILQARPFIGP